MIDLSLYRYRIGSFGQKIMYRKSPEVSKKTLKRCFVNRMPLVKLFIILWVTVSLCNTQFSRTNIETNKLKQNCQPPAQVSGKAMLYPNLNWAKMIGNFFARYLNGNGKNPKGVRNLHLNIRSLQNKVNEIKNIVKEEKPHFLGLSECELNRNSPNFSLDKLKVPGYNIYFPKSWDLHGYARVVVYYKKTLDCSQVPELEDEHLQTIWFKFGFKNSKVGYYCHGYREHTSNLGGSLQTQKNKLNLFMSQWEQALCHGRPAEPNEVYILCDMNLDSLHGRWLQQDYSLYSLSQIVYTWCQANNLSQIVKEVTRTQYNSVSGKTDLSCIDHIYTNCKYKCSRPIVKSFGNSDHDMVGFVRLSKMPPTPSRTIRKRSYKNFDKNLFLKDLAKVDWTDILTCHDLDLAVSCFTTNFRNVLNVHAPWVQYQQRKGFVPWITPEAKELMKQRDDWKLKAKELAVMNRGGQTSQEEIEAWKKFKVLRNKVNNLKKNDEFKFKRSKAEENLEDPSSMWSTVKGFMGWKKAGSPSQIEKDAVLYTKAKEVAKYMNEFFVTKVTTIKEAFKNIPVNLDGCKKAMKGKKCRLGLGFVSVQKVRKILRNLKPSRSVGIDELDSYSIKVAAELIAEPIHHIVTLSIMQKRFPEAWKFAKVLPLHKKGCTLTRKNYRPVSILSPLSKVLERVVYEQLYNHFSRNKLFHQNLMGYRRNRSTLTAVLQMYDRWVRGASEGKISGVILLDLSAAFDLVSAEILVKKLKMYGLEDDCLEWIESYMSNRRQAVWIDHVLSDWLDVSVGVPQGSILGPLLFIIFANDLAFSLSCELDSYADDSTLTSTKKSIEEINIEMNENCRLVSQWMAQNQLCLNSDKTHLMIVGTGQRLKNMNPGNDLDITMDNHQLKETEEISETILGIALQPNLKWRSHVHNLMKKLKDRITGLTKVKYVLSLSSRRTICEGIFNSVLTYCMPVWGGVDKSDLQALQVLQNTSLRHVLHRPPYSNRDEMYSQLDCMTVNQLIVYHSTLTVFKIRESGEPEYLKELLSNDNIRGNLSIPVTDLTLAMKSFSYRAGYDWNRIPSEIRNIDKLGQFQTKLRKWVKTNICRFSD